MKNRDFKNNLRLMTILIFIVFQLPGQFRFFYARSRKVEEIPELLPVLFALTMILYVFFEFLEFKRWNYRYESRKIPQILFIFRFLLMIPILIVSGFSIEHFSISTYLILLLFYSYFVFSLPVSLSICILLPLSLVIIEFMKFDPSRSAPQYLLFFSTYKSLIMVMFYLFAYYWQKDRNISDENLKLVRDLNQSESQLRDYAQTVGLTVALEERTRLARDIHDSVGHALTGIQIQLSKAEAYFELDSNESQLAIAEARESARIAMQDIRSSLGMLNSEELHFSLQEELAVVLSKLKSADMDVEVDIQGEETGFNYAVLLALFRLIQEGATNILKHSEARSVKIKIEFNAEEVILHIEDDGRGFDPEALQENEHYGLIGMKDRMEMLRGKLSITSSSGKGCKLSACLPRNPVSLIGDSK